MPNVHVDVDIGQMLKIVYIAKYGNIQPSELNRWSPDKVELAAAVVDFYLSKEAQATERASAEAKAKQRGPQDIHKSRTRRY